jgi:hypothetical protein
VTYSQEPPTLVLRKIFDKSREPRPLALVKGGGTFYQTGKEVDQQQTRGQLADSQYTGFAIERTVLLRYSLSISAAPTPTAKAVHEQATRAGCPERTIARKSDAHPTALAAMILKAANTNIAPLMSPKP